MYRQIALVGLLGCLALAGCATAPAGTDYAALAARTKAAAAILAADAPVIAAQPGVAADVGPMLTKVAADMDAASAPLAAATTASQAQPPVEQIVTDIEALLAAVPPGALPPPYGAALTAAELLVPVLEAAVAP